jgi:hypothetical protein
MKDLQYAIYNVINIVKIGENYRTIVHLMIKAHNLQFDDKSTQLALQISSWLPQNRVERYFDLS